MINFLEKDNSFVDKSSFLGRLLTKRYGTSIILFLWIAGKNETIKKK